MNEKLKNGSRISWSYRHHLNSNSSTVIEKRGIYICRTRHTYRYRGDQMAYVHFDGNKGYSKVPLRELKSL